MARTTGLAETCNLTAVTMGPLSSRSPAQGTAARPVFTKAAARHSAVPQRDASLRALCSTNRCESMKSKVTYPPKVDEKLSIDLLGRSGRRRLLGQACKSRVWADPKDAGDAALGRRPRPETRRLPHPGAGDAPWSATTHHPPRQGDRGSVSASARCLAAFPAHVLS